MDKLKSTHVVILKDGAKNFEKVKKLSKNKPFIEYSDKGWFCIIGCFNEKDLKGFEYYDLSVETDWQTRSGFQDRVL